MKPTKLTKLQRDVLIDKGTEPPFSGDYLYNEEYGEYVCAGCGSVLFASEHKFDSGSGWPSFYDKENKKAVRLVEDTSNGMHRVAVECANCGGHLGYVFNDAPQTPTNIRFCINSCVLHFNEKDIST